MARNFDSWPDLLTLEWSRRECKWLRWLRTRNVSCWVVCPSCRRFWCADLCRARFWGPPFCATREPGVATTSSVLGNLSNHRPSSVRHRRLLLTRAESDGERHVPVPCPPGRTFPRLRRTVSFWRWAAGGWSWNHLGYPTCPCQSNIATSSSNQRRKLKIRSQNLKKNTTWFDFLLDLFRKRQEKSEELK